MMNSDNPQTIAHAVIDGEARCDLSREQALALAEGWVELETRVALQTARLNKIQQSVRSYMMYTEAAEHQLPCPRHECAPFASCAPCVKRLADLRAWMRAFSEGAEPRVGASPTPREWGDPRPCAQCGRPESAGSHDPAHGHAYETR